MFAEVEWLENLVVGDVMKVRGVYSWSQLWKCKFEHISPVEIYKHRKLDWRECCCPYEESWQSGMKSHLSYRSMVEAGLIHNWPSELFLTNLSLNFCLFFGGELHLESCTGPDDFLTADVVFDVSGTSGTKWLGLHPFKFLLLVCVHKIRYDTIRYDTTLFNYAGHTQQKLFSTSVVLCWTVGVILTFMYCRSISQASNIGCEEDMGQPITLVSAYMCH